MGLNVTDLDRVTRFCGNAPATRLVFLRKEKNGSSVTLAITSSDDDDLIAAANLSRVDFDAEATGLLGNWFTNITEDATLSPPDEGQTALYNNYLNAC